MSVTRPIEPGTELDGGKYKIARLLGHGGMGSVFEARQRDTHKRVAIKCLHPSHATDPESAERLLREARATARVRHPNVVDLYDVGRDGTMIYLVMEFLEGEVLSDAIERADLPVYTMIGLLTDAMRGVAAAHKCGVIHRDIKPDNIFLARVADVPRPVAKVLDFGISKLEAHTGELRALTRSGMAMGTPSYMSFEQLSGEHPIDGRADVYAFGVILYEVVTGRLPHDAASFPELMVRFSLQTPVPPKQLRPELPGTLSRVILWALERERSERIASIDALIRELEPFATKHGFESEQTDPHGTPLAPRAEPSTAGRAAAGRPRTHANPETVPSAPRTLRPLLTCALVALLVVGACVLMWTPRRRAAPLQTSASPATSAQGVVAPALQPSAASQPAGAGSSAKGPATVVAGATAALAEPAWPAGQSPPPLTPSSPRLERSQRSTRGARRAPAERRETLPRDLGFY